MSRFMTITLERRGVEAAVWAGTSGSFVFGWDGAAAQVDGVRAADAPASSTSFAYVNAARHLGLHRVAVAATYPQDVADRFAEFLAAAGIEVISLSCKGIVTAAEERLGEPVLTANQVSVWEGLRLIGDTAPRAGLGALFAYEGERQ